MLTEEDKKEEVKLTKSNLKRVSVHLSCIDPSFPQNCPSVQAIWRVLYLGQP